MHPPCKTEAPSLRPQRTLHRGETASECCLARWKRSWRYLQGLYRILHKSEQLPLIAALSKQGFRETLLKNNQLGERGGVWHYSVLMNSNGQSCPSNEPQCFTFSSPRAASAKQTCEHDWMTQQVRSDWIQLKPWNNNPISLSLMYYWYHTNYTLSIL